MTCFVPAKDFSKKLVKGYRHRFAYGRWTFKFHFKKEVYDWCRKNKIHYKRVDAPKYGFQFKNEADVMAIKLRWL